MNRELQEKRTLIALAEKFGQTPSPKLIQEVAELEALEEQRLQRDADLRSRIATDISEFFNTVAAPTVTQVQDEPAVVLPTVLTETQADQTLKIQLPTSTVDVVKEYISNNIKESTVVNPDPVLARPQKNLEADVKRLEQWISRIAATGSGSGEVNFRYLDDVDRSTINKDWYLTYNPTSKKFQFEDTRVSIEAFDRTTSIALSTTPQLLIPNSFTNSKNLTYDTSTGVFTFLTQCEVTLALSLNALSTASNQRVFQYAERNTGTGFVPIPNSGKIFQLVNGQKTQIVNAQTISRLAGEQIRYFIHATDTDKVTLVTETIPGVTGNTVFVPAIRIQYAGR